MVITLTVAPACGLCVLALQLPGRQACVLLAAHKPHDAARRVLLPFFQLYTTVGLMDTHIAVALAHLLFSVPLAVVGFWKVPRAASARD